MLSNGISTNFQYYFDNQSDLKYSQTFGKYMLVIFHGRERNKNNVKEII